MMYAIEMGLSGMIYLPSSMMIGSDISIITVITTNIWEDVMLVITDQRDLWSTPFRWLHVALYTYKVPWRLVQALRKY
jgi:hypothetical protein